MRTIRLTAFDWVPAFAQGQVRDLRVRWALEEACLPYETILLGQGTQGDPENLARQPFGQVPALEIDGRTLFESGAIVWRIAEESGALLPVEPVAASGSSAGFTPASTPSSRRSARLPIWISSSRTRA